MSKEHHTDRDNWSAHDINLSRIWLPILMDVAKQGKKITYGDLIKAGVEYNPDNKYASGTIPQKAGNHLNVLRQLLRELDLPDISVIVVNKSTGEPGVAYAFDVPTEQRKVYSTDWDSHKSELETLFGAIKYEEYDFSKKRVKKDKLPVRIKREDLKKINWEYWKENKNQYPKWFRGKNDEIVDLLSTGLSIEECYKKVLERGE
jgi:hypothetical protein